MKPQFDVWISGYTYSDNGMEGRVDSQPAKFLGKYRGEDFQDACRRALKANGHDMRYYNPNTNSYWWQYLYDNEADARKING